MGEGVKISPCFVTFTYPCFLLVNHHFYFIFFLTSFPVFSFGIFILTSSFSLNILADFSTLNSVAHLFLGIFKTNGTGLFGWSRG